MNKKYLSALLALVMVLVMALSLAACGKRETPAATQASAAAQTVPSAQSPERQLSLTQASLSVTTWSSPNGATVNLTAVPSDHADGDSAEFVVRLDGADVTAVPCQWENGAYTASAELNAADGYGYYVLLTGKDGSFAEAAVNTPEEPTDPALVELASSLTAYCTLTLNDAALDDDSLTILSGYALIQAPVITQNNENVACAQADLVLLLDGEKLSSVPLTIAPGEADRSYDCSITDMSLAIPETIADGQQLVLRLDAVLTNGQTLTAQGGSWTAENGGVSGSVG